MTNILVVVFSQLTLVKVETGRSEIFVSKRVVLKDILLSL